MKLAICIWRFLPIIALMSSSAFGGSANPVDPVVFTFATVGDSRQENSPEISAQDKIWLQNTKAWSRILREIQQEKSKALFFNGDMIMGYTSDPHTLDRQYAFWRGMVSHLMETGTYVVPIPGNHELEIKIVDKHKKVNKLAQPQNEESWRQNMGDLILNEKLWSELTGASASAWNINNNPKIKGADLITTDQKQMSWSFDSHGFHFVILNTDAVGRDSHAPYHWLEEDLSAAQKRGVKGALVFGHKMAFTYHYPEEK
ncbi:MAG: metallophosphoesterase, partial [Pseudomonadota bacterium]